MVPRRVGNRGARERGVLFVRSGRVAEVIHGNIGYCLNQIYDDLDTSDFVVIENLNGKPLACRETNTILRLLIDEMSEDGYPLIWRSYRGALFVALDRQAAPFGRLAFKQYRAYLDRRALERIFGDAQVRRLERIIGRARYRPPPRHEKFDFHGFLSRDIVDKGEPVEYRLSMKEILKRTERLAIKSEYGRWLQHCIMAFKHFVQNGRFYRDRDCEDLVDFLWDQLSDVSEEEGYEVEPWIKTTSLWPDHSDQLKSTMPDYVGRKSPPLPVLAQALRELSIAGDYLGWLKRCIVKLYDDKELRSSRAIHELSAFLFKLLEDGAGSEGLCIWCGKKAVPLGHYDVCERRQYTLYG